MDLPTDYDAIVVGTGMIESIVAAALSRVGKTVLHLDANEYFGENWASFNLDGFENWVKSFNKNVDTNLEEDYSDLVNENEKLVKIKPNLLVHNASLNHFVTKNIRNEEHEVNKGESGCDVEEKAPVSEDESSIKLIENLNKLSRRFNLDLCPKLLFSKGTLVDLLITSNIARYAEFKSVSRVLTWRDGQLEPVPCSKADVFTTKNITVVHKRFLVKILTLFANYTENLEEFKGFENKTFLEYLKHKKLPENLIHYILYAIAMGSNTTSCLDGVKNCKRFLESLGRYGNTPFIFPMYGSGELPQCFCRLCAVFGGIYCLQRGIEGLIIKDNECVGVISNKKRLNSKMVILSPKYAPQEFLQNKNKKTVSRAVFITDRSVLKGDKESLTLLQFPPIPTVSEKSVTVLELGSGTCTCPDGYFVVHMTTETIGDATQDFRHVVESLFNLENSEKNPKPRVVWSGTWNVVQGDFKSNDLCVDNVKICYNIDSEFDYDISIAKAKSIFRELFPEEEFLPKAPDPDEIVLDAEETPSENSLAKNNLNEPCSSETAAGNTALEAQEKQSQFDNLAQKAEENIDIKNSTTESEISYNS